MYFEAIPVLGRLSVRQLFGIEIMLKPAVSERFLSDNFRKNTQEFFNFLFFPKILFRESDGKFYGPCLIMMG